MTEVDARLLNRTRRLAALWQDYTALPMPWPQADRWLSLKAKDARFGKQDRQFYGNQFFGLCRVAHRFLAAAALSRQSFETEDSFCAHALRVTPEQWLAGITPALNESMVPVSVGTQPLSGPLGDAMVQLESWRSHNPTGFAAMVYAGLPPWAWPHFSAKLLSSRHPWPGETFLTAQSERPLLWLRCQRMGATGRVQAQLETDGFQVAEIRGQALGIQPGKSLAQHPLFLNGDVEIQDLSSQQIGVMAGVSPGQLVWDVCAGGGGKTMQLLSDLAGSGHVWATDVRGHKLDAIRERAKRAGFQAVSTAKHDATQIFSLPPQVAVQSGFDVVLVDAPCTGTGTWRRNADGMLRAFDMETLPRLQAKILQRSSSAVRPGGTLVYATCSWVSAENEAIVDGFLSTDPSFDRTSERYATVPEFNGDTVFVAVMKKKGSS